MLYRGRKFPFQPATGDECILWRVEWFSFMADRLYLSIWFPSFRETEMIPRLLSVLRQFPVSAQKSGVGHLAVYSVSWNEPLLFEQTFDYRADPERALALAGEFLHEDNAYELEALWDLWTPIEEGD